MQDKRIEDLLKQQVNEIMEEQQASSEQEIHTNQRGRKPLKRKKRKAWKAVGITAAILLTVVGSIIGTKPGRRMIYRAAGDFIYDNTNNEGMVNDFVKEGNSQGLRVEDYVTNYLIFGIEEIGGARNTDSIMIASINTKDDTVKLTSLLRDSYVEIPRHKANKLNSAYSKGGAKLLVDTIEQNYKISIDGYASVNFKSFEKIVDLLGGVTIELGEEEAEYLNKTNYISKKANRKVKPGVNKLNGNQVMGYCRVRKVKTLGGANDDYGRIVRQQRALQAIFDSYKSQNPLKLLSITKECMSYVNTSLSKQQMEQALEDMVENKITKLDTFRVPVDGAFDAPKKYNGIGYPLILDWDTNRIELFQFVFNDTKTEAKEALKVME